MQTLRVAFWQSNPVVGDIEGNARRLVEAAEAVGEGADLLVTPECYLSGYPIQDLALRRGFVARVRSALDGLSARVAQGGIPALLVGAPEEAGALPHNSMFLLDRDGGMSVTRKHRLANAEVYDEVRTFAPGPMPSPLPFRGWRIGVPICEDAWHGEVLRALADEGADLLLCPNGSHFKPGKQDRRLSIARAATRRHGIPFAYLNLSGGQDEIVFDGGSFVMDPRGRVSHESAFGEDLFTAEFRMARAREVEVGPVRRIRGGAAPYPADSMEALHAALVTGLRDYVEKSGFPGVIVGMSGGVDSALAAALAVDALGADRVTLVRLPSRHTSERSMSDAARAAEALGVANLLTAPIQPAVDALAAAIRPLAPVEGVTAENLQARARGTILMGLSNATGAMVLSTGNRSEMTVGYATLYGDMCGGFNALKGLWKTNVYALCRWRNAHRWPGALGPSGEVVPLSILERPPTAELAEGQTDEASLGSYDELDAVLSLVVGGHVPPVLAAREASKALGRRVSVEYAERVARLAWRAEYKRRQAAPGIVLGEGSYDRDWRMPLVNAAGLA